MKKTALLALAFACASSPLAAKPHHFYAVGHHLSHHESHHYDHHGRYANRHHARDVDESRRHGHYGHRHHAYNEDGYRHAGEHRGAGERHWHITCDMVRSYVAQVGLAQAKAVAQAAGMTASEERRARHCLMSGA